MSRLESRQAVEKMAGVGKRQANRLIKDGRGSEDYQVSKERKERATADLREHQAEKARLERLQTEGILVPRADMIEEGRKMGVIFSSELNSFRDNAPGMLAGLDELGVRKTLDKLTDDLLTFIIEKLKKI